MRQLFIIIGTELYQLKSDKRTIIATLVYLIILINFILSYIIAANGTLSTSPSVAVQYSQDFFAHKNILLLIFSLLAFTMPALISSDITTGEKERKTLEALLMTYCPRAIIYWGKFLVVYLFSLFPLLLGLLILVCLKAVFKMNFISYQDMGNILVVIFPFGLLACSVLLLNGLKAKTIRGAKSTELIFFILIPFVSLLLFFVNSGVNILVYYVLSGLVVSCVVHESMRHLKSEKVIFD